MAVEDSQKGLRSALSTRLVTPVTPSSYTIARDVGGADGVVDCPGDEPHPSH